MSETNIPFAYVSVSIFALVYILIMVLGFFIMFKMAKKEKYTFYRSPDDCPVLLDQVKDQQTYHELAKKVNTLQNRDGSFLGFKDNQPYDNSAKYCYIGPKDDETRGVNTAIPCQNSHPLYNFPMIKSVKEGTIKITGDKHDKNQNQLQREKDICVMEVDSSHVNQSDVIQFKDVINRHDSAYLMKSVSDYRKILTDREQNVNKLIDANGALLKNLEQVRDMYDRCVSQRIEGLREKVFIQAENDALKYSVIIIGIDRYVNYDNTTRIPRLAINLLDGPNAIHEKSTLTPLRPSNVRSESVNVPVDFKISHIFLPPNIYVKLYRENRSSIVFNHETKGYPKTDELDTSKTIRVEALVL